MQVELKRVEYSARMSEETPCFAADVWIDGTKAGSVRNNGHGGCDRHEPRDLGVRLEAHARTLPPLETKYGSLNMCADLLIGGLLTEHLLKKDLQVLLSKRIVLLVSGKVLQTGVLSGSVKATMLADPTLKQRMGAEEVLNLLPFAEALDHFRKTMEDE